DYVHRPPDRVDGRRRGDAAGIDVAAGQRPPRDRVAEVLLPGEGAGRDVEGEDRVVLGGGDDVPAGDQRLAVLGAVEAGGPRLPDVGQGGAGEADPEALGAAQELGPGRARCGRR